MIQPGDGEPGERGQRPDRPRQQDDKPSAHSAPIIRNVGCFGRPVDIMRFLNPGVAGEST
jgi:hypothetical protein